EHATENVKSTHVGPGEFAMVGAAGPVRPVSSGGSVPLLRGAGTDSRPRSYRVPFVRRCRAEAPCPPTLVPRTCPPPVAARLFVCGLGAGSACPRVAQRLCAKTPGRIISVHTRSC